MSGSVAPSNDAVMGALRQLVAYTQLEDGQSQSFRTRAYEKAIDAIATRSEPVAGLSVAELKEIDGIGDSTARKIIEFCEHGSIGKVERLRERFPPTMLELMRIPGLGGEVLRRLGQKDDPWARIGRHATALSTARRALQALDGSRS